MCQSLCSALLSFAIDMLTMYRTLRASSMVTVEVFDQRRPGRRDPDSSFGTLTVSVADTLDLTAGGHGKCVLHLAGGLILKTICVQKSSRPISRTGRENRIR